MMEKASGYADCVSHHLGAAATLLERYDEAREHYKEAISVCTEIRFRPELALTRLQLAELLLDHYPDEKKEVLFVMTLKPPHGPRKSLRCVTVFLIPPASPYVL